MEEMKKEERLTKAKILFLGRIYFQSYGNIPRQEFTNKMEEGFQTLKFKSFHENLLGTASINSPIITLYGRKNHKLNSYEFTENIDYYRPTILHELIHVFLKKRNQKGEVISTGMHIITSKNQKFKEYIGEDLLKLIKEKNPFENSLFKSAKTMVDFGVGANEGFTEWYRLHVLKNEEDVSYLDLLEVFLNLQKTLEEQGENAVEIIKKFGEGDYEYIFQTLEMDKKEGIHFIKNLDYLYVKEYESEIIKKYLELQKEDKKDLTKKAKNAINKFCKEVENAFRKDNPNLSKKEIQKKCKESLEKIKKNKSDIKISIKNTLNSSFEKIKIKNSYSNKVVLPQKITRIRKSDKRIDLMAYGVIGTIFLGSALLCLKPWSFEIRTESENLSPTKDLNAILNLKKQVPRVEIKQNSKETEETFENNFSLKKGQTVYETCYDNKALAMNYDYQNLTCDSVCVVKNNEVLETGTIENMASLYTIAMENDATMRLRLGIKENEKMTYIAWEDIKDMNNEKEYVLKKIK